MKTRTAPLPRDGKPMGRFLKKYGWIYLPGLLFLVLSSWLQTQAPALLGRVVDLLNVPAGGMDVPAVYRGLVLILAVAALSFLSRFVWRALIMGNSRNLEMELRHILFAHLLALPPDFYHHRKTGDLMAYAVNDIGAVRQMFGPGVALTANAIVLTALSVRNMSGDIHPGLTLFALLPVPLVLVAIVLMGRLVRARFRAVQEAYAAVSDRVQENVSGLHVIKAYGQEEEEQQRFEELNRRSRTAQLRMARVSAATGPLVSLLFGISFSVSLLYGGRLILDGDLTLGAFVAFQGYLAMVVQPVQSVARVISLFQRGAASWQRVRSILSVDPSVRDGARTLPEASLRPRARGLAEIRNLTFQYPETNRPAIRDLSLTLSPGRMVGILGRTGSGKSTLPQLLQRMYDPPEGTVFLDGHDVTTLPLGYLRRQVALAPQEPMLFSMTLSDNIRFFDPAPSEDDIRAAARAADLDRTVAEFPDGYATLVGERGVTLSGGQKQRVSLARALLRKAPVLVLDDPMTAVDTETENRILSGLRDSIGESACLLISGRVSALHLCDEILVLEDGRIIEQGTYDELMDQDGVFAAFALRQAAGPGGREDSR